MKSISGNRNSGKPFLFFGKARVEKFSESIKDMDFGALKKATTNKIFQCLKIPLPLLNEDTMTFSNFSSAQISFYDNCVLPQAKKILDFLNHKLLPILGEKQYKLAIDPASINALEQRKIELSTAYSQTGSLTINEIRRMLGYEAVENGDTIYQPQNLIPVGRDRYTEDNRDKPSDKAFFINLMLSQKEYSEEQIQKLATKYFG
jgi:HK97 family phage portal protein